MLYVEVVQRTFKTGVLSGIKITERVRRVSAPRSIGSVWEIETPLFGGSPYTDKVIAIEKEAGQ